jgi:hypothetical protein
MITSLQEIGIPDAPEIINNSEDEAFSTLESLNQKLPTLIEAAKEATEIIQKEQGLDISLNSAFMEAGESDLWDLKTSLDSVIGFGNIEKYPDTFTQARVLEGLNWLLSLQKQREQVITINPAVSTEVNPKQNTPSTLELENTLNYLERCWGSEPYKDGELTYEDIELRRKYGKLKPGKDWKLDEAELINTDDEPTQPKTHKSGDGKWTKDKWSQYLPR